MSEWENKALLCAGKVHLINMEEMMEINVHLQTAVIVLLIWAGITRGCWGREEKSDQEQTLCHHQRISPRNAHPRQIFQWCFWGRNLADTEPHGAVKVNITSCRMGPTWAPAVTLGEGVGQSVPENGPEAEGQLQNERPVIPKTVKAMRQRKTKECSTAKQRCPPS